MSNVVEVKNLNMAYHDSPVLWNINLSIANNSKTAIVGPNGAGKSTLIKGILGLLKPISGETKILGKDYQKVYKKIAYVPQSNSVHWDFPTTVFDVVLMGRYVYSGMLKRANKKDKEQVLASLKQVGMEDFKDRQISQLSGGQRQRVFLARAICQDAEIYFLDEPMQGVDIKTEKLIIEILNDFQAQGKTIIVVHHDLSTVKEYFDHVIILNKELVSTGSLREAFLEEKINQAYGSKIGEIYGY
jgi:manganese/zinc/iron transport system ATP- binding protein